MIKYIIFDADGVVINKPWMFSVKYCKEFDVPYSKLLKFFDNDFKPCLIGKADLKKAVAKYLPGWGWKKSVSEFLEYWFKAEHYIDKQLVAEIKILRKKGIKCYLASNQERYRANYMAKQMGFNKVFNKLYFSAGLKPKSQTNYFIIKSTKILSRRQKTKFYF